MLDWWWFHEVRARFNTRLPKRQSLQRSNTMANSDLKLMSMSRSQSPSSACTRDSPHFLLSSTLDKSPITHTFLAITWWATFQPFSPLRTFFYDPMLTFFVCLHNGGWKTSFLFVICYPFIMRVIVFWFMLIYCARRVVLNRDDRYRCICSCDDYLWMKKNIANDYILICRVCSSLRIIPILDFYLCSAMCRYSQHSVQLLRLTRLQHFLRYYFLLFLFAW